MESSKVSALLGELERLRSVGSKSIVFSQWTAFLDLLQIPLSRYTLFLFMLDSEELISFWALYSAISLSFKVNCTRRSSMNIVVFPFMANILVVVLVCMLIRVRKLRKISGLCKWFDPCLYLDDNSFPPISWVLLNIWSYWFCQLPFAIALSIFCVLYFWVNIFIDVHTCAVVIFHLFALMGR